MVSIDLATWALKFHVGKLVMSLDEIRAKVDATQIEKYVTTKIKNIEKVSDTFGQLIQDKSRTIINKNHTVDTGQLINSIKKETHTTDNKISTQVYSGTNYARFIHEGTDHKGTNKVHARFVSFKTAPSLRLWAIRKGVIYQSNITGNKRSKLKVTDTNWRYKSKNGKETSIDITNGGLMVKNEPLKFLETPFELYKDKYIERIGKELSKWESTFITLNLANL